jgi:RNA polymerase sigma factor (sigma-70 family)
MATRFEPMPSSLLSVVIQHLRAATERDGGGRTDGELLTRFLSHRDDAALAALVVRHAPLVWGVCRRLLNHHDAEDAFQATFLVLVRKAADVPGQAVANWLYGVARQTAVRLRSTAAKRGRREMQVVNMPEPTVPEVRDADLQVAVDEELIRLPDHYRGVIVLCDLECMTRKEAARQLGIPEGSVASRLARARAMLAKRLVQRGVLLSGGGVAAMLSQNLASAGVPNMVVSSTIKAASLFAAGHVTATGVISTNAVTLTEGVLKAMLFTKLKFASAVVMVFALICGASSILVSHAQQPDTKEQKKEQDKKGDDKLKETLLALDEKLWEALTNGDTKLHEKHLGKDYISIWAVDGKTDKKATLEFIKDSKYSDRKVRDVELIRASKDTAIITYVTSYKVSVNNEPARSLEDRRVSFVWTERDGRWELVFCQTILPVGE